MWFSTLLRLTPSRVKDCAWWTLSTVFDWLYVDMPVEPPENWREATRSN